MAMNEGRKEGERKLRNGERKGIGACEGRPVMENTMNYAISFATVE